jgi:hypothetical protein
MNNENECLCCKHNTPTVGPRICPICGHKFQGNGWDGIDSHWKAHHKDVMPYEKFRDTLCPAHRGNANSAANNQEASLFEIQRTLLKFLLEAEIPFLPRQVETKKKTFKDGHFFRGGKDYTQTTFWKGNDSKGRIYSIAFVVRDNCRCYLELSGETDEKWAFFNALQEAIGGFVPAENRPNRWMRWFEGPDYIKNLQYVISEIRPLIDKYLQEHPNDYARPLTLQDCQKHIDKVARIFNGQNESRIARLCWNTNNWESPSGTEGKSSNKDSYEHIHGFGHEEWLFDMSKPVDGYHYSFIEPIGSDGRKTHAGKTYDLSFYSIENMTRKRFWIGEIKNVEVVSEEESERVHAIYVQNGWLDEMVQQLKAVDADFKIFQDALPQNFTTVRFKSSDLNLLDTPREFSKDDPAVASDYYKLKHKTADPKLKAGGFIFTPGHKRKKKTATITHRSNQKSIELVHNQIQDCMFNQLVDVYGVDHVGTELPVGYGGSVDIAVRLGDSGKHDFYEIKTGIGVRSCIRDALSQLLEYAYYSNQDAVEKLIIVSPNPITTESRAYMELLREKFTIPVYYQRFDRESNQLDSELS